jgi:hypothetical protein
MDINWMSPTKQQDLWGGPPDRPTKAFNDYRLKSR